jgi:hypothetical protein
MTEWEKLSICESRLCPALLKIFGYWAIIILSPVASLWYNSSESYTEVVHEGR